MYYSIRLRRLLREMLIWDGKGDQHYKDLSRGNSTSASSPTRVPPQPNCNNTEAHHFLCDS